MLALLTDSTADLSAQQLALAGVGMLPARLTLQGREFLSSEVTPEEMLRHITAARTLPTIAAPTAQDYSAAFRRAFDEGADEILSLHISRKLSKSYENGLSAARAFGDKVSVFDNASGTYALGLQVLRAGRLRDNGAGRTQIEAELERVKSRQFTRFALDTVKFLQMSGRVTNMQAFLGNLLGIKPIFKYEGGLIEPSSRERGMTRAINSMAHDMTTHLNTLSGGGRVAFVYTPGGEAAAHELRDLLRSWGLGFEDAGTHLVGTSMLTVSGPKAVGVIVEPL